ncbi:MAG TPA: hypothetical protein DCX03_01430 [Bacteroidales bacterium]|nr:hypothetical protein [Bacteroidales bacterium]
MNEKEIGIIDKRTTIMEWVCVGGCFDTPQRAMIFRWLSKAQPVSKLPLPTTQQPFFIGG